MCCANYRYGRALMPQSCLLVVTRAKCIGHRHDRRARARPTVALALANASQYCNRSSECNQDHFAMLTPPHLDSSAEGQVGRQHAVRRVHPETTDQTTQTCCMTSVSSAASNRRALDPPNSCPSNRSATSSLSTFRIIALESRILLRRTRYRPSNRLWTPQEGNAIDLSQ